MLAKTAKRYLALPQACADCYERRDCPTYQGLMSDEPDPAIDCEAYNPETPEPTHPTFKSYSGHPLHG